MEYEIKDGSYVCAVGTVEKLVERRLRGHGGALESLEGASENVRVSFGKLVSLLVDRGVILPNDVPMILDYSEGVTMEQVWA